MQKHQPARGPLTAAAVASLALAVTAGPATAAVFTYQGAAGVIAFNTAAGGPPIAVSFDDLPGGDIADTTIRGVTFSSPDGNTLEILPAASTFTPGGFTGVIDANTNRLVPTSGLNVLSPGGPELAPGPDVRQDDSLELRFATPLTAFGLDILFQSYDCCTFVRFRAFDSEDNPLASGDIFGNGGVGGNPGGSTFFGIFSTTNNISRLVFDETDANGDFPDANVGYDSFRFGAVPEPSSWAMMIGGFGLAGAALRRRRRALT